MPRALPVLRSLTLSLQALALAAGAAALTGCDDGALTLAPLATEQRGVTSMTTDGTYLYWATASGAVRRVSVDGGPVETVVDNLTNPGHVVVDGSHVYMTTQSGFLSRAPKAGGAEEPLFVDEQDVAGVQLDDAHVYWARKGGDVKRADKTQAGAVAQILAADAAQATSSIARGATSLFWTANNAEQGAVREVSVAGGNVSELHSGSVVRALATSDKRVAWATLDPEPLDADPTANELQITAAALDGGDPRVIVRGLKSIDSLVIDQTHAYWSTLEGDVSFVSLDGGEPTVLTSGAQGKTSVALDLTQVYWARANGESIFARPKPDQPVFQ